MRTVSSRRRSCSVSRACSPNRMRRALAQPPTQFPSKRIASFTSNSSMHAGKTVFSTVCRLTHMSSSRAAKHTSASSRRCLASFMPHGRRSSYAKPSVHAARKTRRPQSAGWSVTGQRSSRRRWSCSNGFGRRMLRTYGGLSRWSSYAPESGSRSLVKPASFLHFLRRLTLRLVGCFVFRQIACQSRGKNSLIEFVLTERDDDSSNCVAAEVGQRTASRHEAIDAKDQRHARNRHGRHDRQRRRQRDEASTGDARSTLRA